MEMHLYIISVSTWHIIPTLLIILLKIHQQPVQLYDDGYEAVPKYNQTLGSCLMDSYSTSESNYVHEMEFLDNLQLEQWKAMQFNYRILMDLLLTISGSIKFAINIERQK